MRLLLTIIVAVLAAAATVYLLPKPQDAKSASLYDRVMDSGTIRCGYMVVEPGLIKDANTGELSGIVHDLVEEMAKNLSLKIEWVAEYGPGELVTALESGKVDMICSSIWLSSARARAIDATDTLYVLPSTIWMKAGSATPPSFNTPDTVFTSIEGSTSIKLAKVMFPEAGVNPLPEMSSIAEMLLAVAAGKGTATILPIYTGERFLENNPGSIRNALSEPLRRDPVVMLLPRGEMAFKSMVNNALKELHYTSRVEQLINKYNQYPNALLTVAPQ